MTDVERRRPAVAALYYRAAKGVRGAPSSFAAFTAGPSTSTPGRVLAHMGDVMDWALSMANGSGKFVASTPRAWDDECARFFAAVTALDARLASPARVGYELARLFQAPVADAPTHTGQLTLLRRLRGGSTKIESYNRADIEIR